MFFKNSLLSLKSTSYKLPTVRSVIKKSALLFSGALLLSTTCYANESDSGFYAGAGISYISTEDSGAESSEIGGALMGGYAFSQYFSTELSVFNLGDHKELGMQGMGGTLGVIASYPIFEKFSLFAEAGAMAVNIEIDEAQNIAQNNIAEESLQDGVDASVYFGIGAKYRFTDWSLVLKATAADLDADITIISAQAHYHF